MVISYLALSKDIDPGQRLTERPELLHRWTVYLLIWGFLTGLGLCLVKDLNHKHQISESPCTLMHSAHAGGTSALLCDDQFDSHKLVLASSLVPEQNTSYEGVSPTPPSPPPRG